MQKATCRSHRQRISQACPVPLRLLCGYLYQFQFDCNLLLRSSKTAVRIHLEELADASSCMGGFVRAGLSIKKHKWVLHLASAACHLHLLFQSFLGRPFWQEADASSLRHCVIELTLVRSCFGSFTGSIVANGIVAFSVRQQSKLGGPAPHPPNSDTPHASPCRRPSAFRATLIAQVSVRPHGLPSGLSSDLLIIPSPSVASSWCQNDFGARRRRRHRTAWSQSHPTCPENRDPTRCKLLLDSPPTVNAHSV
jgi:hypothetical protein